MAVDRSWDFTAARALLADAQRARSFPAAVIEVASGGQVVWREAFGSLTYDARAAPCTADTVFDLASLTKVIATTSIAMRQIATGVLDLDARVARYSALWRGEDRADVTVRQLLDHSSGLPAHARLFDRLAGPDAYEAAIGALPLDRPPGRDAVYSDPGFILLGILLARTGGAPLDQQLSPVTAELVAPMLFNPPADLRARIAPTEVDPWRGRLIIGEVHDENAAALGGIAGHAGLFATAAAVGSFARLVMATFQAPTILGSPALMRQFASRGSMAGSSRALGWDIMLPTSSCGTRMSATAIGHTGFTGTSLWIDWERSVYVVLLSNRVHPSREPNHFAPLRPRVHDAVMDEILRAPA